MLSILKSENDVRRLEKSGRLLSYRFSGHIFAVAAEDQGDAIRYLRAKDVAERGYASSEAAWSVIQETLSERAKSLSAFGMAPFWFADCPGWPPSSFLIWKGLCIWAQSYLQTDRPLMAASFSADQLILGYADSTEFHDRLGHAREAPVEQPLLPLPFLLRDAEPPLAIKQIDLHLGEHVSLYPEGGEAIELPLLGE